MHFVYLLQSKVDNSLYIGKTENLEKRIIEHNSGKGYFTNRHKPYELVYYEAYVVKELSEEREKQLKRFGSACYALIKRIGIK